jgi:hypothetical protein
LVSRGKEKHGFNTEEGGEAGLKFTVLRKISGDQARCACAES